MTLAEQLKHGLESQQAGRLAEAEASYRLVLASEPNHPDALHLLGGVALMCGKYDAAVELIGKAISLQPNRPEFYANFGLALQKAKRLQDAATAYHRSLELDPSPAQVYSNLGNVLTQLRRIDEAMAALQKALAIEPAFAEAIYNLGNAFLFSGRLEEAVAEYRRAVAIQPAWREANNNLGHTLFRLGRFAEAEEVHRKAVELLPTCALSRFNYGVSLLRRGDFERGWPEYEHRLLVPELGKRAAGIKTPRWDGSPFQGKRLLLCAEQGFGDTIQFVRYIPRVAELGGDVTVLVQPEVLELVRPVCKAVKWEAQRGPLPPSDLFCVLPSLPRVLGTTLATIPSGVPYLHADAARRESWAARMPKGKMKIGLVWAGQPRQHVDRERSIPLRELAGVAASGAWLVSLQKGEAAQQITQAGMEIADFSAELKDFSDTAALMENLDLIITVDTAAAHLAGALGRKVWLLLPLVSDWRWLLDREDSPWYPTMRLFRQKKMGDWSEPIERLTRLLSEPC